MNQIEKNVLLTDFVQKFENLARAFCSTDEEFAMAKAEVHNMDDKQRFGYRSGLKDIRESETDMAPEDKWLNFARRMVQVAIDELEKDGIGYADRRFKEVRDARAEFVKEKDGRAGTPPEEIEAP